MPVGNWLSDKTARFLQGGFIQISQEEVVVSSASVFQSHVNSLGKSSDQLVMAIDMPQAIWPRDLIVCMFFLCSNLLLHPHQCIRNVLHADNQ